MQNQHTPTIIKQLTGNPGKFTRKEIAKQFNISYDQVINIARSNNLTGLFRQGGIITQASTLKGHTMKPKEELTAIARLEGKLRQANAANKAEARKYQAVVDDNARLQQEIDNALLIRAHKPKLYTIKPSVSRGTGEATAVVLLSDVHCEEVVQPDMGQAI